jgi:hypothetical protein
MEYVSTFDLFVIYTCTANVGVEVCIYKKISNEASDDSFSFKIDIYIEN